MSRRAGKFVLPGVSEEPMIVRGRRALCALNMIHCHPQPIHSAEDWTRKVLLRDPLFF